jgi:hypothetical protein
MQYFSTLCLAVFVEQGCEIIKKNRIFWHDSHSDIEVLILMSPDVTF